uniref:Insulin-like domain-containing protein n=1 Tax=Acrobeloides nanus TaxID=290746 RepID=A0A914E1J1_9BILA
MNKLLILIVLCLFMASIQEKTDSKRVRLCGRHLLRHITRTCEMLNWNDDDTEGDLLEVLLNTCCKVGCTKKELESICVSKPKQLF